MHKINKKEIGLNLYLVFPFVPAKNLDEVLGDQDLLKCRYIQCGIVKRDCFTGMIYDYYGNEVYGTEYWVDGECLGTGKDASIEFTKDEIGKEIKALFETYIDEEDGILRKVDFNNHFEKFYEESKFFQLKGAAKIAPINGERGVTDVE